MYDYFGFHTRSVIKHLKAKFLQSEGAWDNIQPNWGLWCNSSQ